MGIEEVTRNGKGTMILISWLQMLTLKFQQRQRDKIEAASQSVAPILNSSFQNRWPRISFVTFGPFIKMPLD